MTPMSSPTADVSVRIAWADDAEAIAAIQARAWAASYAGLVPAAGRPADRRLRPALARRAGPPADARHRALVALERNRVVGFAITTPATDPDCDPVTDGELMEFTVDAAERGRGHGSRLLQAAVDTMVADRFTRAVTWLVADDDDLRTFLTEAGWAPDSAHRDARPRRQRHHPGEAGPAPHRRLPDRPLGFRRGERPPWRQSAPAAPADERSLTMFGPLPLLHRIVARLDQPLLRRRWPASGSPMSTPLPLAVSVGALVGGLVGLVAAYAWSTDVRQHVRSA